MDTSPELIVRKLTLKGLTTNYEAVFNEGLNIIWGDMDSGKSSILNLIDYCLGGSNKKILYGEISAKARVAYLELSLNNHTFTIERDIFEPDGPIKVYSCPIELTHEVFPMFMSPTPSKIMPDGWISDFILESLGIAKVKIKESNIRADANEDRLSFRDLMKLMYLKQTLVGSDSLLDAGNPVVFAKNVSVQKFVYNIHDDRLASLKTDLMNESKELSQLKNSESSILKFLKDVDIDITQTDATNTLEQKKEQIENLEKSAHKLKRDFSLNSEVATALRKTILQLKNDLNSNIQEIQSLEKKQADYAKLKNTYSLDLECLNISKLARPHFQAGAAHDKSLPCPLCSTNIPISSPCLSDEDIDNEIKSIKNRFSGVQASIDKLWEKRATLEKQQQEIQFSLNLNSKNFDEQNIASISPIVMAIEAIEKSKNEVNIELAGLKRNVSISGKFNEIQNKIGNKNAVIANIKRNIQLVEDGLTGLDDVITSLSGLLSQYLKVSGLQNVTDIYITKNFTPYFRGISYYDTSSGGVKTITSIGSYLTRLKFILKEPSNLPTFLMIDTPGQNIGRYKRSEDDTELSDPALYENIYKQMLEIVNSAKSKNRKCQVIVVDNDLPNILNGLTAGLDYHLVKRFSKRGGEYEKGLINDY